MDAPEPTPRGDPVIYRGFVDTTEGWRGEASQGWRQWRMDVGIALLVCVAQLAFTTLAARGQPEREPLDLLAYALLAVGPLALVPGGGSRWPCWPWRSPPRWATR
jgi:hypothetical protein